MRQSDTIAKLADALAKAQAEIKAIGKDRSNSHFGNKYATLDAIMEGVRGPLAKHGLSVIQGASETADGFYVESLLIHSSGEYVANVVPVPVDKRTAQGLGSALTYGRRYGVSALLVLATDEDDDGNAAVEKPAPRKAKPDAPAKPERIPPPPKPLDPDWNGTLTDAAAYKLSIKGAKLHGTPLGEIPTDALEAIHKHIAMDPKYVNLTARVDAVLADRKETENA